MRLEHFACGVPALFAVLACLFGTGCGSKGPKFHEVNGKIEFPDGDISLLKGSTVEAALDSDNTVRASGEIQADGTFALQTLHEGVIKKGAREGTYKVRILLGDDEPKLSRQAKKSLPARYFKFEESGLTFQVPADKGVTLQLSAK